MKVITLNDIKKDLYKTKAEAKLLYYDPKGDLVYEITTLGFNFQFPIHLVKVEELVKEFYEPDEDFGDGIQRYCKVSYTQNVLRLNPELKGAVFPPVIKGSELIRWIAQAIKAKEFSGYTGEDTKLED